MTNDRSQLTARCQAIARSKWLTPLICLGLGGVVFAVFWLGGDFGDGVISLAVLAAFALILLLLTGRSETVRGLTVGRDERFAQLDLRATAVAGLVVLVTMMVAWLVEIAHGHNGNPYGWLLAIGGLAYLVALAVFRWRG
jgi:multisubunit Na+/H+ antiporter MnhB subunit